MGGMIQYRLGESYSCAWLSHGATLSRMKSFAYGIASLTNAEIRRVYATVGDGVDIPEQGGNMSSLKHSAHIFVREERTQKLYAVKILSPNYEECFDDDQEVLIETGDRVARLYSSLAGNEFTFDHGALAGPNFI